MGTAATPKLLWGDVRRRPAQRYLCWLTVCFPGIGLAGDRDKRLEERGTLPRVEPSGGPVKIPARVLLAPPGVLITASGLQGVQPLVDRTM